MLKIKTANALRTIKIESSVMKTKKELLSLMIKIKFWKNFMLIVLGVVFSSAFLIFTPLIIKSWLIWLKIEILNLDET